MPGRPKAPKQATSKGALHISGGLMSIYLINVFIIQHAIKEILERTILSDKPTNSNHQAAASSDPIIKTHILSNL